MPWSGNVTGLKRLLPRTLQANPQVARTLALLPKGARVADIGAGGRKITPDCFTIDAVQFGNTSLVCDAAAIPLPDASFDCIFCTALLEHVPEPQSILREIKRLLAPGGIVHIEVPFIQPYHPDPSDYWRWTLEGLRLMTAGAGFEEMESGPIIGPATAIWRLSQTALRHCWRSDSLGRYISGAFAIATSPVRYADYLLIRTRAGSVLASGLYFRGRRRETLP